MDPGIYTLVLSLDQAQELEIGSLGIIHFFEGYYCYTGSARGPGSLKRVERHKEVLLGHNLARRWHIDYLLPHTSLLDTVVTQTSANLECWIAAKIGSKLQVIPKFGSTDCRCPGHLHFSIERARILEAVRKAHQL